MHTIYANVRRKFLSPTSVVLILLVSVTAPLPAQTNSVNVSENARALVRDLRADSVHGNAAWGIMDAIPKPPEGLSGLLRDTLDSEDYQQRQLATYLLLELYEVEDVNPQILDNMVEGLGNDSINAFNTTVGNASYFSRYFEFGRMPEGFQNRLLEALDDEDRQRRHYATWLLTHYYGAQDLSPTQWPPSLFQNLVEGLHNDAIHGPGTFNNHTDFLRILLDLEEARPQELLREALNSSDAQARFGAAFILPHYHAGTVQPEVSAVLWSHLKDDGISGNGVSALGALIELGRENAAQLLEQHEADDWQQAAYAQCLAAWFGLERTVGDAMAETWLEEMGALYANNVALAGLYLMPERDAFFLDREMPRLLKRMVELEGSLKTPRERARWLHTWLDFMPRADGTYDQWEDPRSKAAWAIGHIGGRF